MSREARIVAALKRINSGIPHVNIGDADTGTYDPDTGALYADPAYGLPSGYIWVRRGGARHAVRARNVGGIAPLNLVNFPVKVGENTADGGLDVIGINWERARDIFGNAVYQAAQTPRLVTAEEIGVGRAYLAETGSFRFRVLPFYYWDSNGELRWWPDAIGSEVDVLANVAATAGHHNLSVICLDNDATNPTLTSVASAEQSISASLTREDVTLVSIPDGYYPLMAVHHYAGDTTPRSPAELWRLGVFMDNGGGGSGGGLYDILTTDPASPSQGQAWVYKSVNAAVSGSPLGLLLALTATVYDYELSIHADGVTRRVALT